MTTGSVVFHSDGPPSPAASAHLKIRKARTALILDHPFFGTVAVGLTPLADPDCTTAWTDGKVLAFNPVYINALSSDALVGLTAHLVLHTALRHHTRRGDRDPSVWNMACDHTINWVLIGAGLRLPEGYLDDPDLRHLPVETVYERLLSRQNQEEGRGASDPGQGDKGDGQEMEGDGPDGDRVDGDADTTGETGSAAAGEDDGEAAGEAGEDPASSETENTGGGDPGGTGEVRDAADPGDGGDGEKDSAALDAMVARALLQDRDAGSLPAEIERMVRQTLESGQDWRMLLSRFIDTTGRSDYAWSPPNRRYLHQGLYLPSVRSEEADQIVVVVDTSGSIADQELALFCDEVSAVLAAFPGELLVLGCDTVVGTVLRLDRTDLPITPQFTGGGGTDFRTPFRWLEQEGILPRCLIYFTDLACDKYPAPPAFPVLWAACGTEPETSGPPPFGDVVRITGEFASL